MRPGSDKAAVLPKGAAVVSAGNQRGKQPKVVKGPFGIEFTLPEFEMPTPRSLTAAALALFVFAAGLGAANFGLADAPYDLLLNVTHSAAKAADNSPTQTSTGSPSSTSAGNGTQTTSSAATPGGGSQTSSSTKTTTTSTTPESNGLPPIKHVWIITLSDQGYDQTFHPGTGDSYLSTALPAAGEVFPYYFGVAEGNLANDIALLSGQGPTTQTAANCPDYTAFKTSKKKQADYQQVQGKGCVYPKSVPTLMSELQKAGYTWKAYVQGLGTKLKKAPSARVKAKPKTTGLASLAHLSILDALFAKDGLAGKTRAAAKQHAAAASTTELAATCRHPELGAKDPFESGANGYATWENPVLYFQSVIDSKNCATDDVGLNQLTKDLNSKAGPPNLSLIDPDPCDNGSDTKCNSTTKESGTAGADVFLRSVLPKILGSSAYKQDGLVIVTFDQANQTGYQAGLRHYSCCGPIEYPNVPAKSLKTGATETYPVTQDSTCTSSSTTGTTTATTTATGTAADTTTPTGTTTTGTTGTTGTCVTTIQQTPACTSLLSPCSDTGGGGDVGMVAISPYIKARSIDDTDVANDFSLLYELEDLFELPTAVGDSADPNVQDGFTAKTFFNNPNG